MKNFILFVAAFLGGSALGILGCVFIFVYVLRGVLEKDKVRYKKYEREPISDIILSSREEAESVLTTMNNLLETYKVVSLADFKDLQGVTSRLKDNKWGWIDLKKAHVISRKVGYSIWLPKPMLLN